MQNVIPQISDVGMPISRSVPAILFKDGKYFSLIIYDVLGIVIDLIEFEKEDIDKPLVEGREVEEEKLYFVDVIFYDIFFDVLKLHSVKEVHQSVNSFLKEGNQRDINFMRQLFRDCKTAHELGMMN
jgi:hypothetical protein